MKRLLTLLLLCMTVSATLFLTVELARLRGFTGVQQFALLPLAQENKVLHASIVPIEGKTAVKQAWLIPREWNKNEPLFECQKHKETLVACILEGAKSNCGSNEENYELCIGMVKQGCISVYKLSLEQAGHTSI